MITVCFAVCMLLVFGKMLGLAIKATWGIFKVVCTIIFLPIILIAMAVSGLLAVAFPALIIIGLVVLIKPMLA